MDARPQTFLAKQDGSVILETALMITVLLVLAFGMIDFGRVMYTQNNLISAAREGARVGSVQSPFNSAAIDTVKAVVLSRFNAYTFGSDALTTARVVVVDQHAASTPFIGDTIKYAFKWLTPVPCLLRLAACGADTTQLKAYAAFRYEP